jgi:hypothetical protein
VTQTTHPTSSEKEIIVSKATVSRLFIGGAIAVVAGSTIAIAGIWVAMANGAFVMNGPDIVAVRGSLLTWSTLGLALVGGLVFLAGVIVGFLSWIGALLNTAQLPRKGWFVALLLLGVFSFGFIGMIAYLIAGPRNVSEAPRLPKTPAPAVAA